MRSVVIKYILGKMTDVSKAQTTCIRLQERRSSMLLGNVGTFLPDHKMAVLQNDKRHSQRHVTIKCRIQCVICLNV